jgi:hypothetical protein
MSQNGCSSHNSCGLTIQAPTRNWGDPLGLFVLIPERENLLGYWVANERPS